MFSIKFQRLNDVIYVNLKSVFYACKKTKYQMDFYVKQCKINLVFDNYMLLTDFFRYRGITSQIFSDDEWEKLYEFLNFKRSTLEKERIVQLEKVNGFLSNPTFDNLPCDIVDEDLLINFLKAIELEPKKYLKCLFENDEKWEKFFDTLQEPCETDLLEYYVFQLGFLHLEFYCEEDELPYISQYEDIEDWRDREFNSRFKKLFKKLNLPISIYVSWIDFYDKAYFAKQDYYDKKWQK